MFSFNSTGFVINSYILNAEIRRKVGLIRTSCRDASDKNVDMCCNWID